MSRSRPQTTPIRRGDLVEVEIVARGEGPDGIAKLGDYVVFVPGTLPGERVFVEITSAARKFGRGEPLELLLPAADRVEPFCKHFLDCGGCHLQHQLYGAQLDDKRARLSRGLAHALGERAPEVAATIAAKPSHGQRHKVALHLRNAPGGRLEGCFHRQRSVELVAVRECPASDPLAWDLANATVALLAELPLDAWHPFRAPDGLLRTVLVRATTGGEAHVLVVAREARVPGLETLVPRLHAAGATTISVNTNDGEPSRLLGPRTHVVSGPRRITEEIGGVRHLLSPSAFFQTSPQAAAHLVDLVLTWLRPTADDDVADLYCGAGLLTLPLARRARAVLGCELAGAAVDDAVAAAELNGIHNVHWFRGRAEHALVRCRTGELPRPRLVALDPPRRGLEPAVIAELAELRPSRIAYVSCEPQTLQRDLAAFDAAGFRTTLVTPVDMFPHTSHVEAVAWLTDRSG
ncbi:MAG: 23S rRNA (uracil(1939)-C(5))-methyltransferase RlmD [Planctomycetes bacterium]|nr:23S rRNA (uracil(1939)-C(5))-methyltransferase RlmD [Planctomycetota bacterium]